ncbi:unnamed protein product [Peniophora sp. CBMAI 1063]|nr:unnamed protein product [Peniophora sp. CBMAI 1063]
MVGPPVDVDYALPPAIEKMQGSWMSTLQSGAVVTSVIAGVEAQLLVFYSDNGSFGLDDNAPSSKIQIVIQILTYVALVCSVSATITSLFLIDEFGEIPTRAARYRNPSTQACKMAGTDWSLLEAFRLRRGSKFVVYHWLSSILAAALCTVLSTAVYVVSQKPLAAQVIITVVTVVSVLPFLYFVVPGED